MESEKKFEIRIGLFALPLEEQLKDFNIPKEKTDTWEKISSFIYRNHMLEKITDRQEEKLFKCLFEEIKEYIRSNAKNGQRKSERD